MPDARSPDPVAAKAGPEGVIIPDARGAASPQAPDPAAAAEPGPVPVVAVVGRPNVGKSTLVNRILGRRQAVVEDIPGVTRDRVAYDATWSGRAFTLVDTGGWDPAVKGGQALAARVAGQARLAVDAADAVLFVVDAVVGATDADQAVAAVLRRSTAATAWSASVAPTTASTTNSTASAASTASLACPATRAARAWLAFTAGSHPPVSTRVNARPDQVAS